MSNYSSSNVPQLPIPIFAGFYYDQWVVKMRTILISYELWDYVECGYEKSNAKNNLGNSKNDAKALSYIQQGLCPKIFPRVQHATKAKQAWDILEKEFEGNSKAQPRIRLRDRLAPAGTKREKALMALTMLAMTTSITTAAYHGIEKLSHHLDSSSSEDGSNGSDELFAYAQGGASVDVPTDPSFVDVIFDIFAGW